MNWNEHKGSKPPQVSASAWICVEFRDGTTEFGRIDSFSWHPRDASDDITKWRPSL